MNYIHHNYDITDKKNISKIFDKYSNHIKLIIHCAAQPSHDWAYKNPMLDFKTNAEGTLNLLENFKKYCPKAVFINLSTNKVYGDNPNKLNLIEKKTRFELSKKHKYFKGINEKMDIQNLRDSDELKEILSTYKGELKLICGHIHRNIVTKFGNVICQIAPGVSHAVTIDLRKGSPNCLTKEPGSFLLHEIRDGILTHQIQVDDYDGPYLFYPE